MVRNPLISPPTLPLVGKPFHNGGSAMGPGLFDGAPFTPEALERHNAIKEKAYALLEELKAAPGSADNTLAIRKLEECVMWANKSLSRN